MNISVDSNLYPSVSGPRTWMRLLPIIICLSYLGLTIVLFVAGPWQYPVTNPLQLYSFLFLAHLALLIGYLTGAFRKEGQYCGVWSVRQLVLWSALTNLILFFPTSQFRIGQAIPDVAYGLRDPGGAYALSQRLRDTGEPLIEYARILLGPVLGLLLPLTVFYWPRLTRTLRMLGAVSVVGAVVLFISMGTNNVVANTVLLVPSLVISSHFAGVMKLTRRGIAYVIAAGACGLLVFLSFFGTAVSSRTGSPVEARYFSAAKISPHYDNFMMSYLGDSGATTLSGLDIYLTQGYYALSLSLKEPFVPMFGAGNSMFLSRQVARITGDDQIEGMSYPARIEKYGWDAEGLWSSIYPWIASDVSFPGTLLVVFIIGRLFALSWLDTLNGANPFAVVMFSQFLIMLFYFPANNQLLQSGEGFAAFWVTLALWHRTRRSVAPSNEGPRRVHALSC